MDDKPTLRPIEVFPMRTEQGVMVCLRDPSGLSDRVVTASPHIIPVLQLLDGTHSLLDMQTALTRATGSLVQSEDLQRIIDTLDEALLLDNERFRAHREQVMREFAGSPVRHATSAGHSYPDDPAELREFLDKILGMAPAVEPASKLILPTGVAPVEPDAVSLRGLVAPHIDHVRGVKAYAAAYAALQRSGPADLFILLGTAHAETAERVVLTRKDFETPLGTAKTDPGIVDALAKSCGRDVFADEFVHAGEHSVELELVFVQHLMQKAGREFRAVPVLCGSCQEAMESGKPASELPGMAGLIDGLRETIAREKGRVVVIAGADLAHVGPRFGGEELVTPEMLGGVETADRASLGFVEKGDADGFVGHVAIDFNARNVCGVGPIYVALKALAPCAATLLGYEQWADEDGSSAVTFAAMTVQ